MSEGSSPRRGRFARLTDLEIGHVVDVHVVDITVKLAFGNLGGFGGCLSLDFVGLHFVVEVFYIDLEQMERGAGGLTIPAGSIGGFVGEGVEERGLERSCHDLEVLGIELVGVARNFYSAHKGYDS